MKTCAICGAKCEDLEVVDGLEYCHHCVPKEDHCACGEV